jgi:hypothetical protein
MAWAQASATAAPNKANNLRKATDNLRAFFSSNSSRQQEGVMSPSYKRLKILPLIITFSISALLTSLIPAEAVNYSTNKIHSSQTPYVNATDYRHRTINNAGQIIWVDACVGGLAVYLREPDGNVQQISNVIDSDSRIDISINDKGQVVWDIQQDGYPSGIYLSEPNSRSTPITIIQSTQSVFYKYCLNNMGQIAWNIWNDGGPLSIYGNGTTISVSNCKIAYSWDFNNNGEIVWQGKDNNDIEGIYRYNNGESSRIINDWNYMPLMNDSGQIVLLASLSPGGLYLYDSTILNNLKTIYLSDAGGVGNVSLNNHGRIVFYVYNEVQIQNGIYLYDLNSNDQQLISQNISVIKTMLNNYDQVVLCDSNRSLYLSTPAERTKSQKIIELASESLNINDHGYIVYYYSPDKVHVEIYLATPKTEIGPMLLLLLD